jgi:hypothetical protein
VVLVQVEQSQWDHWNLQQSRGGHDQGNIDRGGPNPSREISHDTQHKDAPIGEGEINQQESSSWQTQPWQEEAA